MADVQNSVGCLLAEHRIQQLAVLPAQLFLCSEDIKRKHEADKERQNLSENAHRSSICGRKRLAETVFQIIRQILAHLSRGPGNRIDRSLKLGIFDCKLIQPYGKLRDCPGNALAEHFERIGQLRNDNPDYPDNNQEQNKYGRQNCQRTARSRRLSLEPLLRINLCFKPVHRQVQNKSDTAAEDKRQEDFPYPAHPAEYVFKIEQRRSEDQCERHKLKKHLFRFRIGVFFHNFPCVRIM